MWDAISPKRILIFFVAETGVAVRIANNAGAIGGFVERLGADRHIVIYEATGRYGRTLSRTLAAYGLASKQVNPTMAKRFAQATGQRAKTDRIDAAMLAEFGARLHPKPDPSPCPDRERLADLHTRRDQLVELRKKERTRLKEANDDVLTASLEKVVAMLSGEIDHFEKLINDHIKTNDAMRRDAALLETAPGVGPVTRTTLIAQLPELGTMSPKAVASLAGLAPFNHDSGRLRGKRCISGGRRRVRHALYLAALSAIKACDRYRAFYLRLCERNQAKKIAIIAVARKLLTALNAMIRDQKEFA